ncbi:MAG: hypothetical protein QXF88_01660 [Candidatus Aenigmatarchaeota archaeon]
MAEWMDYTMKTGEQVYKGQLWHLGPKDNLDQILNTYDQFIYSILTDDGVKRTLVVITSIEKINEQKG